MLSSTTALRSSRSIKDIHCVTIDGINDYLTCADNDAWSCNGDAYSVSCWVSLERDGIAPVEGILGKPGEWWLCLRGSSLYLVLYDDGSNYMSRGTATTYSLALTLNQSLSGRASSIKASLPYGLNHIVATWDGSTSSSGGKLYLNGLELSCEDKSESTGSYSAAPNTSIPGWVGKSPGYILSTWTSLAPSTGKHSFYDLALYDKELTSSEVTTIYRGRTDYNHKEGSIGDCVAWYRMGDGDLDINNDSKIYDNIGDAHLIMTNMTNGDIVGANVL